jgi:flagellar hook-associated protein 2
MSNIFSGVSRYSSDLRAIIDRAVAIQSLHLTQLSQTKIKLSDQSKALSALQSKFDSLANSLTALKTASGIDSFSSSTSTEGVVQVNLSEGVAEGSFMVHVTSLGAQTVTMSTNGLATVSDPGKDNISAATEFTLTVDGESFTISPAAQNLKALAEAINAAHAGVRATLVNVGAPSSPDYRLSITSNAYADVAITLSDGETELLETLTSGANAKYSVNGVAVSSDSRKVILSPGVSITLVGESAAGVDTTVTVGRTTASAKNALSALATAYNTAMSALDEHRGENAGVLAGDMLIRTLADALRKVANYEADSGGILSLTALGFTFTDTGELKFDGSTFDAAVQGKTDELIGFLEGFKQYAQSVIEAVAGSGSGAISTASDLVTSMIAEQDRLIQAEQERVDLFEENITARMNEADALIASLEQQVEYYTNLFEGMRNYNKLYS